MLTEIPNIYTLRGLSLALETFTLPEIPTYTLTRLLPAPAGSDPDLISEIIEEIKRRSRLFDTLREHRIDEETARELRDISHTLQEWGMMECGSDRGDICRDDAGNPRFRANRSSDSFDLCPLIPDLEKKTIARLGSLAKSFNRRLIPYVQSDPRGCALYLMPVGEFRRLRKLNPEKSEHEILACHYPTSAIAIF